MIHSTHEMAQLQDELQEAFERYCKENDVQGRDPFTMLTYRPTAPGYAGICSVQKLDPRDGYADYWDAEKVSHVWVFTKRKLR